MHYYIVSLILVPKRKGSGQSEGLSRWSLENSGLRGIYLELRRHPFGVCAPVGPLVSGDEEIHGAIYGRIKVAGSFFTWYHFIS